MFCGWLQCEDMTQCLTKVVCAMLYVLWYACSLYAMAATSHNL